jgi:hypothetical protein
MSQKIYGQNSEIMKPRDIQTTLPSGRRCAVSVFNVYLHIAQLLLVMNQSITGPITSFHQQKTIHSILAFSVIGKAVHLMV